MYFTENTTYTGSFQSRGGAKGGGSNTEAGGPGTAFLYHLVHTHRTLLVDNGGQHPLTRRISDYSDLSRDGGRAWILPESGGHDFANGSHDFHFEELQIYGGAHLAILTEPVNRAASLFFRYMIGDRTGMIHISQNQVMNLHRLFLDIPFSAYIYDGGYLGLAPISEMNKIIVYVEGTLDHIRNLTILNGGELHCYLTGSTGERIQHHYNFNETVNNHTPKNKQFYQLYVFDATNNVCSPLSSGHQFLSAFTMQPKIAPICLTLCKQACCDKNLVGVLLMTNGLLTTQAAPYVTPQAFYLFTFN